MRLLRQDLVQGDVHDLPCQPGVPDVPVRADVLQGMHAETREPERSRLHRPDMREASLQVPHLPQVLELFLRTTDLSTGLHLSFAKTECFVLILSLLNYKLWRNKTQPSPILNGPTK